MNCLEEKITLHLQSVESRLELEKSLEEHLAKLDQ